MKLINATPHEIVLINGDKEVRFPKTELIARVSTVEEQVERPFPAVRSRYGMVEGLPEQEEGTFYIVSSMVLSASDRTDLVAPDTGKGGVRDEKGFIKGVTRFMVR